MFDVGVASLAILFYTSANNEAGNLTWPTNCKGPIGIQLVLCGKLWPKLHKVACFMGKIKSNGSARIDWFSPKWFSAALYK
jgi:hypothetical protein